MPTYEYVCVKCGNQFEKFQSMAEKPLRICPEDLCRLEKWGKGKVKRLIGAGAGLIFKGSGFYITDYRSESYKEAAKKESPKPAAESKTGSGDSAATAPKSTPAKPAAKPAKPGKTKE